MKKKKSLIGRVLVWLVSLIAIALIPAAILFNNMQSGMAWKQEATTHQPEQELENKTEVSKASYGKVSAPLVSVIPTQVDSYPAIISVFGEAKARHSLNLNSLVSGRITWVSSQFEVGRKIKKGTELVRISKRDYLPVLASAEQKLASAKQSLLSADQSVAVAYENVANAEQALATAYQERANAQLSLKQELQQARLAKQSFNKADKVASAQSEVNAAVLALKEEKSKLKLAQNDWKLAGLRGAPSELASRQPQIAAANARLHAAKLALQSAQYDFKQKNTELVQRQPQIAVAKAHLNAANVSIKSAKKRLVAAQKQVEVAQQNIKVNKAQVKAAQHNVEKAQDDLTQTSIKAPFNAVVTSRAITQGSYATVGQNLGQLQSSDQVEVTLSLSAQQWRLLPKQHQQTQVTLYDSSQPHRSWEAKIERSAQFINAQTRTRNLIVRTQNKKPKTPLLVGSFLQATIYGKQQNNVLKIPSSALSADGFVWLVDQNNELQRMNQPTLFSQDDDLYIAAPQGTEALSIVRWPLASYLPGMRVNPQTEAQQAQHVAVEGEEHS